MTTKRILAIGEVESLAQLRRVLRRSEYEMQRVPASLAAIPLVQKIPFDLVVATYPLADTVFEGFYRELRSEASQCRESQLLVLTREGRLPDLDAFHRDTRLEVAAFDQPEHRLAEVVARYLGPIRSADRYPVRWRAAWPSLESASRTVNVSMSGALIGWPAGQPPRVKERGRLELRPPDPESGLMPRGSLPPLRLNAEVARHARPEREETGGFAVFWVGAAEGEIDRLEELLSELAAGTARDD